MIFINTFPQRLAHWLLKSREESSIYFIITVYSSQHIEQRIMTPVNDMQRLKSENVMKHRILQIDGAWKAYFVKTTNRVMHPHYVLHILQGTYFVMP